MPGRFAEDRSEKLDACITELQKIRIGVSNPTRFLGRPQLEFLNRCTDYDHIAEHIKRTVSPLGINDLTINIIHEFGQRRGPYKSREKLDRHTRFPPPFFDGADERFRRISYQIRVRACHARRPLGIQWSSAPVSSCLCPDSHRRIFVVS